MTKASRDLVIEKIRAIFPDRAAEEVLAVLDAYGREAHEKETDRVHLAILKLCDEGSRDDPTPYVEAAKADYRDVLAWAEYPNQMRRTTDVCAEDREALRQLDAAQYRAWLAKKD